MQTTGYFTDREPKQVQVHGLECNLIKGIEEKSTFLPKLCVGGKDLPTRGKYP